MTQPWDQRAAGWFRPHDEWGAPQARLGPVIDALEPRRAYAVLCLVTAVLCLRDRSWRPAAYAAVVATVSMGATSTVKLLTHRADPTGDIASTGGSFPSGHIVALSVCLACSALMCFPRTRWWCWVLVCVPPAVMAAALLYTKAHWMSDVVGGALLALATTCWAASMPLRASMADARHARGRSPAERRRVAPESR